MDVGCVLSYTYHTNSHTHLHSSGNDRTHSCLNICICVKLCSGNKADKFYYIIYNILHSVKVKLRVTSGY